MASNPSYPARPKMQQLPGSPNKSLIHLVWDDS